MGSQWTKIATDYVAESLAMYSSNASEWRARRDALLCDSNATPEELQGAATTAYAADQSEAVWSEIKRLCDLGTSVERLVNR